MRILNPSLAQMISDGQLFALNLGAGPGRPMEGFFSLDIAEYQCVDVVADLNCKLSLIPCNSVAEIYSRHTLEHIDNLIGLLEEIVRICVPGAPVKIVVPHFSNPLAFSDPTHKRFFGLYTFFYFSDSGIRSRRQVPTHYSDVRFVVDAVRISFYRQDLVDRTLGRVLEYLVNRSIRTQEFYEKHLAFLFPAWEVTYSLRVPL